MKRLTIITLLLMLIGIVTADVYTIGTGTSTESYIPFYGLYDYGWSKTIYTAAELSAAGLSAGQIDGIGYEVGTTPSNYIAVDQRVYMRHTTASLYDTADNNYPDNTAFQNVYNADYTWNGGGWHHIMFTTPFIWDGTSNIEILWENWDGDYASGPSFRYTSTSPTYLAVYKYTDDSFPTTTGTRYYNRPNIQIVTPQLDPPNPAVLVYPTNAGYTFLDGVLFWASGGGMPTGYDVYLDTVDGSTLVSDDQTSTSYTPTLSPATTYFWKVVPYNANGPATGCPVWSFSTPGENQIAESFDATDFPPLGWTTPGGAFTRSTTTPYYGPACAYEYIATGPSYLYTPMLEITERSELDWWMRTSATTGIGRVQIVYSEDAAEWFDIGDEIVMPTETTWMNYNVDLSALAGNNYMIGFKVYSSTSTSTYFYIDHVFGPDLAALAPEPASVVHPTNAGWAFTDAVLSWNPLTVGGIPTSYDVYFGTTNPPAYVQNQTETTYTPTLAGDTTYYWQIVPRNGTGSAEDCPIWSFSTPSATQIAESFEVSSPFLPLGWSNPGSWSGTTTSPFHGSRVAYKSASTTPAIIATPMLEITASSTLDFYYRTSSTSGYGLLNVKCSEDLVTWTQVGTTISMPTTTTWNNASVDLSSLAGNNYYLAFEVSTSSSTAGIYLDHVFGPEYAAIVPTAVTLTAPVDQATDINEYPTFTWTAGATGGIPSGYRIYCDTNPAPTTEIADVLGTSYTATTALAYNTTYYWKVVAYNTTGDAPDSAVYSFTTRQDPTIYVLPWLEDFGTSGTTFPPTNWYRGTGMLADPSTITSSTTYWIQDDWANDTTVTPVNYAGRMNIYSTNRSGWFITPPVQIPGAGYQLELDIALTDYGNYAQADSPTDDRFIILIGDGSSWSTANVVREWNNTGSPYVYDNIPYTGEHVTILLDSYVGTKYIAFYGESIASGGDNDFFVDNVLVRATPIGLPDPVTLTSPADEAENLPLSGFNLSWNPATTGGIPSEYSVFMGSTVDVADYAWYNLTSTTFDPTQSTVDPITFAYGETWYWTVMASNGDGDADVPTPFSFTIMDDPRILSLPYSQNFDGVTSPNLPAQWVGMVNPTSTSWYVDTYSSTTYAVSQPNTARMYNSSSTTADIRLISPEVVVPMNSIKLSFSARGSSGYTLLVGTTNATDATGTFNQLASIPLTATHTTYSVSFADYLGTDTNICFKHGLGGNYRSIYIDDVYMEELTPNDLAVTAFTGDGFGIAGDQLSYTVTVMNNGTAAQAAYSVQLLSADARDVLATVNISESLAAGASAQHTINWTPSIANSYDVYAKVVLAGDANPTNDESDIMQVLVFASTSYISAIGDPASTSTVNYLPFNFYYKNNVAEVIYLGSQMQMASGTINAIIYQNNFTQDLTKPVRIWMKHTTENVNSAWLPFADYTLVFQGNVHFPLGVNAVVIPLDTPFNYTGGNLAVRTYREFEDAYWNSTNHFYYTMDASYPNRTRYFNQDGTTPIDPTAPSSTGTQTSYIPHTAFIVDPHTAMPPLTAPAVQIAMDGINPKLTWNAVDGAYLYVVQGSDDPYDWNAATELTVTPNLLYTITSAPAKKFYRVLSRSYNHQDREIGQVFNPASVIGFDNSAVRALPSIPNTEDKN